MNVSQFKLLTFCGSRNPHVLVFQPNSMKIVKVVQKVSMKFTKLDSQIHELGVCWILKRETELMASFFVNYSTSCFFYLFVRDDKSSLGPI